MMAATDVRRGHVLRYQNALWVVYGTLHVTKGNLRGFVRIKMRNISTEAMVEEKFSSADKFEQAYIDQKDMEYLYLDGQFLVFMDPETADQVSVPEEALGEDRLFIKENMTVKVSFVDNAPITVELPNVVELKVLETEPSLKGATVTNVYKPAKLETGASVQVPPFIEKGEIVKIDTRNHEYVGRVER
jgi:elongation factor P